MYVAKPKASKILAGEADGISVSTCKSRLRDFSVGKKGTCHWLFPPLSCVRDGQFAENSTRHVAFTCFVCILSQIGMKMVSVNERDTVFS